MKACYSKLKQTKHGLKLVYLAIFLNLFVKKRNLDDKSTFLGDKKLPIKYLVCVSKMSYRGDIWRDVTFVDGQLSTLKKWIVGPRWHKCNSPFFFLAPAHQ